MSLELFHVGEHLIAGMLLSLTKRKELHRVRCEISSRSLAQDTQEEAIGEMLSFCPDVAKLRLEDGHCKYLCDPKQTVDVLCAGITRAIAFESKLGKGCMTLMALS